MFRVARPSLVHSHLDWVHLPVLQCLGVPSLTTLHGRLDLPNIEVIGKRFPNCPFVSISESQRTPASQLNWLDTIHNGLPLNLLQFGERPEEYLAFLGRVDPEKGPDVAIRVAHAAGLPLRIAGKIPRGQNRYFKETIQPLMKGKGADFVGRRLGEPVTLTDATFVSAAHDDLKRNPIDQMRIDGGQ
jgi:glycosyltransferase involved in cell wall biosynthesis